METERWYWRKDPLKFGEAGCKVHTCSCNLEHCLELLMPLGKRPKINFAD